MAVTDGDHDDATQRYRQMVGNLRRRHPEWMIIYGTYSQKFWAFPLFTALPGHYVGATDSSGAGSRDESGRGEPGLAVSRAAGRRRQGIPEIRSPIRASGDVRAEPPASAWSAARYSA